jgi:hypothetical protein
LLRLLGRLVATASQDRQPRYLPNLHGIRAKLPNYI